MSALRARLGGEDGLAAALVVIVLSIMMIGAATVFAQSVELSGSVNRDDSAKRALQAAEAGLSVAKRRLNMLRPADANCVTTQAASPDGSGWCAETASEVLGRGQSFTYRVSRCFNPSPCAAISRACTTPVYTLPVNYIERCIVAVGQVNGVRRRLEMRVAGNNTQPMFPVLGLLGLDGIVLNDNVPVKDGPVASNGRVDVSTTAQAGTSIQLSPNADPPRQLPSLAPYTPATDVQRMTKAWTLAPPNFAPGGLDTAVVSNYNSNFPVAPSGDYDAATRTLTVPNNQTVTLGSSAGGTHTYNFCRIVMNPGSRVVIATPSTVLIYLDSPLRPGSGCPAGTGDLQAPPTTPLTATTPIPTAAFDNGDGSNNSAAPLNLRIQVWGNPQNPDSHEIFFPNRGNWSLALYAPYSHVKFRRSGDIDGAIAARRITVYDGAADSPDHFHGNPILANLTLPSPAVYYKTGWRQCNSTGAAADPC